MEIKKKKISKHHYIMDLSEFSVESQNMLYEEICGANEELNCIGWNYVQTHLNKARFMVTAFQTALLFYMNKKCVFDDFEDIITILTDVIEISTSTAASTSKENIQRKIDDYVDDLVNIELDNIVERFELNASFDDVKNLLSEYNIPRDEFPIMDHYPNISDHEKNEFYNTVF